MILYNPSISGSLVVTGSSISLNGVDVLLTNQTSSISVLSSSFALTSSYVLNAISSSYAVNALTGSNAMTASSADTLYVRNNVTALGSITAQTLVVQTVTSSVLFTTGSNIFGSSLSNVQQLTGSVGITGSLAINGTTAVVGSGTANYVPKFTASGTIGNSAITDDGTTVTLVSRALSGTSATFSGKIRWGSGSYESGVSGLYNLSDDGTVLTTKTGTVRDFLLANGNGATVMTIPTGTQNVTFSGAATFAGNVGITVANTPEILLTHSNTSKTFLMAVDGTNAFFRANSTNSILFQVAGSTTALTIASSQAATFSSSVTADGLFRSNQGIFQVYGVGTFRGGLYNYAQSSGSGTDYSPTLLSETDLYFTTGGSSTKKVVITSAGNVGIGETNPTSYKLQVGGTVFANSFFSATGYSYPTLNVWTTFYTIASDQGIYSISIGLGNNDMATWYAYGTVFSAFGRCLFQSQTNGSLVSIRISGMDIQVLLGTGASFTRELTYKVLRS